MTDKTIGQEEITNVEGLTAIDPNQMYTARLEFKSIGNGVQVQPFFSYSHSFADDYTGEYPAAFLAMRDIAMELASIATTVYNTEIDDADLPEDKDAYAELAIATAQAQAEKTTH